MSKIEVLKEAYKLVVESSIFPEKDKEYFAKLLLYADKKGWLWLGREKGAVKAVGIGYRVKDDKEETLDQIPEKSEGDIFFVPLLVSKAENKYLALKLLKTALKGMDKVKKVKFYKDRRISNGKERPKDTGST